MATRRVWTILILMVAIFLVATVGLVAAWAKPSFQQVADLIGSMLGAALAAGAAILVFEYQERKDVRKLREHFRDLLEQIRFTSANARRELDEDPNESFPIAVDLMLRDYDRLRRFIDAKEFEDIAIARSAVWFEILDRTEIERMAKRVSQGDDNDEREWLAHQIDYWVEFGTQSKTDLAEY